MGVISWRSPCRRDGRSILAASAMQRFLPKKDSDIPSAASATFFVAPFRTRARTLSYFEISPSMVKVRLEPGAGTGPVGAAAGVAAVAGAGTGAAAGTEAAAGTVAGAGMQWVQVRAGISGE